MTTPKLCPETIKACIEALGPTDYTIASTDVEAVAYERERRRCKDKLKALLERDAAIEANKIAGEYGWAPGSDLSPLIDCILRGREIERSSGYLKESEG